MRILAIEDSPTQAEELRLILESGGFDVEVARNAEQGLERLERLAFDFVISDVVMPGLSGYDLCRRIKSDARWKALPILLLMSLGDPIDVIRALECGADSFLTKPYEPDHLVARVANQGEGGAPGKGLGLAFCRMAVEAHGGRIWVEDNQPHGSVFVVRIPIG